MTSIPYATLVDAAGQPVCACKPRNRGVRRSSARPLMVATQPFSMTRETRTSARLWCTSIHLRVPSNVKDR